MDQSELEQGIFEQPSISESAKDLVRRMLVRDTKKRLTAHEVLSKLMATWVQVGGVAPDKPLDSAILSRLKQFSTINKLKKIAIRVSIYQSTKLYNYSSLRCVHKVVVEILSEEEIAGLKEMFKMIGADNSGQITLEELKNGLEKVDANLKDSEISGLMQAPHT
ncbi:hypothetical protein G4B88_011670 [Cannabis sativa]|uniref:EF-hand domain-containing protein n=1 Tax=Cannabis sativa TaxID=3483 RepID=A0A7J6FRP5_CANSA|nr:hypothetical protein G4B88_011670 [Cannabis sativa]